MDKHNHEHSHHHKTSSTHSDDRDQHCQHSGKHQQHNVNEEGHNHHSHGGHMGHHDHHAHMVEDFKKRFYISLIITIPILILSPMSQMFLGANWRFAGDMYLLFALSSIVFFYGGWPFLSGAKDELKDKSPGMMMYGPKIFLLMRGRLMNDRLKERRLFLPWSTVRLSV